MISARNVALRLVEIADAAFIYGLRTSARGRYLSPVADDPRAQEEWIRAYKVREARAEELYFVVNHRRAGDVGALRMHAVERRTFWWGSWIVAEHAPVGTALESLFLVYELGFLALRHECARFVVRKGNPSLGFHARLGARIVQEDGSRVIFELTRDRYSAVRPRLARRFSPGEQLSTARTSQDRPRTARTSRSTPLGS